MSALIACDIHPLNNLRVLEALRARRADSATVSAWIGCWINEGFTALETLVQRHGRGFAFGDAPTLADCHLVPQIYAANRFGVDLTKYPALAAAGRAAAAIEVVIDAHPERQPDADRA